MKGYFKNVIPTKIHIATSNYEVIQSYDTFEGICRCLTQAFVDSPDPFFRLTAPMTWVSDRRSDDHMGTELVRCRSQAGQTLDHG